MKKLISIAMATLAVFAMTTESHALQVGVGASAWYADWKFDNKGNNDDTEFDPTLLYGPILTLGFSSEWSLSGVFLYGVFDNSTDSGPDEISRFDSDITLNYSINNYFKMFLGAKYMGYKYSEGTIEGSHTSYGPGLGISLVVPLADNLYFLCTLSGLYLWGTHEDPGEKWDYNEPGLNTSAALAYHFTGVSTVISLGGRYQYFRTQPDTSDENELSHTFYGVTLSAIYSFSI